MSRSPKTYKLRIELNCLKRLPIPDPEQWQNELRQLILIFLWDGKIFFKLFRPFYGDVVALSGLRKVRKLTLPIMMYSFVFFRSLVFSTQLCHWRVAYTIIFYFNRTHTVVIDETIANYWLQKRRLSLYRFDKYHWKKKKKTVFRNFLEPIV